MIKLIKKWVVGCFPIRHTELTAIRAFRLLFLSICYIGVAAFLGYDIYTLCQDQRTLIYQDNYKAIIPLPIVYFDADFYFTVNCAVVYLRNNSRTNCNNYVGQTNRVFNDYYAKFNASDLSFADSDGINKDNVISYISLTVNIEDTSFTGGNAGLQVWFTDKETEFDLQSVLSNNLSLKGFSDYLATAEIANNYFLANNQSYSYLYERKITNRLTQSATNVLTGDGKHTRTALIDGFIVSYPGNGNYSYIEISPNSYVVRTSTETSNMSVLDVLSDLGGIYAAALILYKALFGGEEVKPWGLVQNLPLVRRRVRSALRRTLSPNIPFTGPALSKNLSLDEKVAAVEHRQLALELFLKEYVVNVDNIDYDRTSHESYY